MSTSKIRSYAKINLSINITGKTSKLHKIESLVMFAALNDEILIKKSKLSQNKISFIGKFSKGISKKNTISKLLVILEKKKILRNQKFIITINKRIPNKAGLGGGSMNAASVLKYFVKKKIIRITEKELYETCKLIGSDVILGLNPTSSILSSKNKVWYFKDVRKFYILIVKPNFGCDTAKIYSRVKKFHKMKFKQPSKKFFELNFLKKNENQLEPIAFAKYPKLRLIKSFIENINDPFFVRMTGSGSALVAYYQSKEKCENAKKKFKKKYKNYWCISSKTI